jgi:DNA-binding LytR/AlgR family response regulator
MEEVRIIGEASNGVEGVLLAREKKPDLVFLDIFMPDMDGNGYRTKAERVSGSSHVRFVTLHNEKAVEAFELDALDYIVKPLEPHESKKP